jgi:hypothetical protein
MTTGNRKSRDPLPKKVQFGYRRPAKDGAGAMREVASEGAVGPGQGPSGEDGAAIECRVVRECAAPDGQRPALVVYIGANNGVAILDRQVIHLQCRAGTHKEHLENEGALNDGAIDSDLPAAIERQGVDDRPKSVGQRNRALHLELDLIVAAACCAVTVRCVSGAVGVVDCLPQTAKPVARGSLVGKVLTVIVLARAVAGTAAEAIAPSSISAVRSGPDKLFAWFIATPSQKAGQDFWFVSGEIFESKKS